MPGTKQLFVLRHAKSSWDDPGLADHERPLSDRGHRAVRVLNAHIRESAIEPALVLCSTARRTRETLAGVAPGGEHVIEPELYSADARDVLERLRRVPEDVESVMVVGHNPAMQTLVLRLAAPDGAGEFSSLGQIQRKFPTGALAALTFEGSWSQLSSGSARLTDYVRPKSLGA
jgi:phosphohistidine phosphatase